MKSVKQECWTYYMADGCSHSSSRFQYKRERMEITGKYLFFSTDREALIRLAKVEIEHHGFAIAKVSNTASGADYVLCLYWKDDSRKRELFEQYREDKDVKYRWWKSDADTVAGIYSEQYRSNR